MREVKISIGQRFGMLKVIGYAEDLVTPKGYVHKRYLCKCECGNEKLFTKRSLTIDKTQSCGCLVGKTFKNIEGMQFDRLKAISIHHINEGVAIGIVSVNVETQRLLGQAHYYQEIQKVAVV